MASEPKTTHTPGPWAWFTGTHPVDPSQPHMKWLVGADGQGLAMTPGLIEPTDTANANLIAAAPELLAALRRLVWHDEAADLREGLPNCAELEAARDAIATAEGR